jgi:hypothetical protein
MSGYDSSSFKKNVPTNQKQLKEFTVGPPEFDQHPNFGSVQQQMSQEELEAHIKEARRQKLADANKISNEAKKRLEILADIGRATKDVQIGEFTFSLRTLKAKEAKEAALATFSTSVTQLEASFEARKQQLARSLFKIDGELIEMIIGSELLADKLAFIEDNLEDIIVEKLWSEFVSLKEEVKNKYSINTVKEAEEVSEDLKK